MEPLTQATVLANAALAGIAMSAPPGPVGALCVTRTLRRGLAAGMSTGAGAAVGDALYGVCACYALVELVGPTRELTAALAWIAVPILAVVGFSTLRRAGREAEGFDVPEVSSRGAGPAVLGGFVLTLCAPGTLPGFLAAFSALGLADVLGGTPEDLALVGAGVLGGATLWWLFVCYVTARMRHAADAWMLIADRVTGAMFLVGSAAALFVALRG